MVRSRTKWILAKILFCQCGAKTCHISEACEKPGVCWGQFGVHAFLFLFKVMPVFSESQAESFPTRAPESTRCRFSCMLIRRGSESCPQPYPINGKRLSFVKEKSNESCSLFGTECFGEEKKKWLRSDSFGLACQEIFSGCISPADKAIAQQVAVNLMNYINHCIHAVLTLAGLSRWISAENVDASLCVQAVAVLCNSPVLPEEQGRGCGRGQNAPIVSPAAAFPWPAGARS